MLFLAKKSRKIRKFMLRASFASANYLRHCELVSPGEINTSCEHQRRFDKSIDCL